MITLARLMAGLYLLFFAPLVYAEVEGTLGCAINSDPYLILSDEDGNITVQGKVNYTVYPEDTKMSDLLKKVKGKSNRKKLKIPEYVVWQDFLAIKRKDVPAICENFSKKERQEAKERYKEIESISKFYKDYDDLEFWNKSYFGNYIRIIYNCIGGPEGETFPARCYLKLVGGRYYVTHDFGDYQNGFDIFTLLASSHPWDLGEKVSFQYSDKKFMVNLVFYAKDDKGREIKENPISLSYNSVPYPPNHSIFLRQNRINDKEVAFFYKAVETFRKGSNEEILHIWHPDNRKDIAERLSKEKQNILTNISQFRFYFKKVEDIYIVDKIFSSDGVVIYYEPVIKGKRAPLQTIVFKKSKHNYFLAADNINIGGSAELLQSKYILDSVEGRLAERKAKK